MCNMLECHFELDLFRALQVMFVDSRVLWGRLACRAVGKRGRIFPVPVSAPKGGDAQKLTRPPHPIAMCQLLPFWASFPRRAKRLIDTQQSTLQSTPLMEAAATLGSSSSNGGPALLLWPSAVRGQQMRWFNQCEKLETALLASGDAARLLMQCLLSRLEPEQVGSCWPQRFLCCVCQRREGSATAEA